MHGLDHNTDYSSLSWSNLLYRSFNPMKARSQTNKRASCTKQGHLPPVTRQRAIGSARLITLAHNIISIKYTAERSHRNDIRHHQSANVAAQQRVIVQQLVWNTYSIRMTPRAAFRRWHAHRFRTAKQKTCRRWRWHAHRFREAKQKTCRRWRRTEPTDWLSITILADQSSRQNRNVRT